MVLIKTIVNKEQVPLYMDDGLYTQLNKFVIPSVRKKDADFVIVVEGEERSGKSVLAQQLAKILDPDFSLNNVCFTADEFINAVTKAKKYQCIVFDEAFTGLSSRTSLSEVNHLLVSLMMEMGQKNLFIIIVMPSLFLLDRYVVLHRAKGTFHVYMKKGRRGYWRFFNKNAMKYLYLTGKKFYEYKYAEHTSIGRFRDQYTINEADYRKKKASAFKRKKRLTRADNFKNQRDMMIFALMKELGKSQREMSRFLAKYDIKLSHVSINDIYHSVNKQLLSES